MPGWAGMKSQTSSACSSYEGGNTVAGLSREKTQQFVHSACKSKIRPSGRTYYEHCQAVAERTESLLRSYLAEYETYSGSDFSPDLAEDGWHSAFAHDFLDNQLGRFDDLMDAIGIKSAMMVADLSVDQRLSSPRQVQEHISKLCEVRPVVRIIKLADILCEIDDCFDYYHCNQDDGRRYLHIMLPDLKEYFRVLQLGKSLALRPSLSQVEALFAELTAVLRPAKKQKARTIATAALLTEV